jgi:hypothetical protein
LDARWTAAPYNGSVIITLVVRLVSEALGRGQVSGEVEDVKTGARATVRSVDDFVWFAGQASGTAGDAAEVEPGDASSQPQ